MPAAQRDERARAALTAVRMNDFAGYYPSQLSGGMKQRVALARGLCLETGILLMDEPFAALDEQTRMVFGEDLSVLLAETGKTIVLVTHSLREAVFLSDRVFVMSARPAEIKATIEVKAAHPREPSFTTSSAFSDLRNQLYALLRGEIEKTVGGFVGKAAARDRERRAVAGQRDRVVGSARTTASGTAIRWPRATPPRIPSRDRRKTRRGGIPYIQWGHGEM